MTFVLWEGARQDRAGLLTGDFVRDCRCHGLLAFLVVVDQMNDVSCAFYAEGIR